MRIPTVHKSGKQSGTPMTSGILHLFLFLFLLPIFPCVFAQSDSSATSTIQQIGTALRAQQFEAAIRLIEPELQKSPDNPRLWSMKGVALAGLGRDQDALAAYQQALKTSPDYLPALEGAAQIDYAVDDPGATALLEHILKLRPEDATSHAMLGTLAYKEGDCAAAVKHFERSKSALDSQPIALRQYGACFAKLDRAEDAVAVLRRLVELQPNDSSARVRLAAAQLMAKHPEDASATLEPLLRAQPEPRVAELAAAALEAQGKTQDAVGILNRAVAAYPRDVDLYVDLAGMAMDHHSFASGIEVMSSGQRVLPGAAPLYLERGILYVQMGEYAKAEADFDKAAEMDPLQTVSAVGRGKIAEQRGDFTQALEAVEQKLAKNPEDAFLLYTRAEILAEKGAEPGSADFRQALDSARKAVTLQPHLLLARNLLCSLYLRAEDYPAAAEQARKVLQDDPYNETAVYHLVMVLRKDPAARNKDSKELAELLQRLARLHEEANRVSLTQGRPDLPDDGAK